MNKDISKSQALRQRFSDYIDKNQYMFLAIIIIFIGALWRIWGLSSFKGFSQSEINLLTSARRLAENYLQIDGSVVNLVYLIKVSVVGTLTGYSPLILRLFSALMGIMACSFFFLFVKNWFNKQVALIATLLMATNTTMLIFSSVINPTMMIIALQMAILYVVTLAFRDKNIWLFLLTAALASAGMFLSPFFILLGILIFAISVAMIAKNLKIFTLYKFELIALIIPTILSFVGYIYLMRNHLTDLLIYVNPGSFANFYLNIGKNVLTIFSSSEFISNISVSVEPILDPFVVVSTICGIIYAFFHGGKRKHQFILLWLLLGLILISLAGSQTITGIALLTPVIFIISAMMLDYLLTSWVRTFPFNKPARLVMTLLFSLFLFLSIYYNFQKFFYGWQGNPKISSQYSILLENKK